MCEFKSASLFDRGHEPKPFIWTASATDILEKVKRARKTLVNVQSV